MLADWRTAVAASLAAIIVELELTVVSMLNTSSMLIAAYSRDPKVKLPYGSPLPIFSAGCELMHGEGFAPDGSFVGSTSCVLAEIGAEPLMLLANVALTALMLIVLRELIGPHVVTAALFTPITVFVALGTFKIGYDASTATAPRAIAIDFAIWIGSVGLAAVAEWARRAIGRSREPAGVTA